MDPILLINPNSSEQTTKAMVAIARRHLPGVIGWTNRRAPGMITDPCALANAADQLVAADLPAARAVIVAAFGDPGAGGLSAKLDVPIVGIGVAAARAAGEGRVPFAVVTTTPRLAPSIDVLMRANSTGPYSGCFVTEGDPLVLMADAVALDIALIRACKEAAKAGAKRIIIGGGPLATAAIRIAEQVPLPLVQPLVAACREVASRIEHRGPPAQDVRQPGH